MPGPDAEKTTPQTAKPATPAAPPRDSQTSSGGSRRELGKLGFDAAQAALTPPENRTFPPEELTPKARMEGYQALRGQGANPAWMNALQEALGVLPNGAVTLDTIDAIAALQVSAGKKTGLGLLDAVTLRTIEARSPVLAKTPRKLEGVGLGAARGEVYAAGAAAPEDEALQNLGMAKGYGDYATRVLKNGKLLGQTITAHPEFHARLANAVAYLRDQFPGKDDAKIGERLGFTETSSFRASTATSDQMHHGSGFALDINPLQNRWLFGPTRDRAIGYAMERAALLFDQPAIVNGLEMAKNAQGMDTEHLFAVMQESNDLFWRYRQMCQDKAAIKAYVESPECPPKAKAKGLAYWLEKMPADEGRLAPELNGMNGKPDKSASFMDMKEATVIAMRDAAGLRWGGADLGGDNGDLMHFDGNDMGTAQAIRGATLAVQRRRAAAKAAADKPAEGK